MKTATATRFHAGFLLGLFFRPEDGGDIFLRNVGLILTDYTALYPRRYNCSYRIFVVSFLESDWIGQEDEYCGLYQNQF
jgi:hypothetical protein